MTASSNYEARRICHDYGVHEWQQKIQVRILHGECAASALEKRSLLVLLPEIAKQWDKRALKPNKVAGRCSRIVWLQCQVNSKNQWSSAVAQVDLKTNSLGGKVTSTQ